MEIIGIDHGNGNIKTSNVVFPCGFHYQDTEPNSVFSKDILAYNNGFYSLVNNRFSYQTDKTTDENAFILTLFAIAKELIARNPSIAKDGFIGKDIILAVGLPPAHFEKQVKNFKEYFKKRTEHGVNFRYNQAYFNFYVKDIYVYPQDFAAAIIFKNNIISKYSTAYCIDIGDGTTDLIGITNGAPDKDKILSREIGMSKLRNDIMDDVINDYGVTLDSRTVEDCLAGKEIALAPDIANQIYQRINVCKEAFATELVNQLHSKVADFRVYPTIFCGGGAAALKEDLINTKAFGIVEFIEDIKANAAGYEQLTHIKLGV